MTYKPQEIVRYVRMLYDRFREAINRPVNFSDLEMVVAGAPINPTKENFLPKDYRPSGTRIGERSAFDNYFFQNSNIEGYKADGKNIIVTRGNDKKQVVLHPGSIRHDSLGYAKQVLANNGIHPTTATLKKIAKLLDRLSGSTEKINSRC